MPRIRDGRSERKAKVVPFLSRIEKERKENLKSVVNTAQMLSLEGFENIDWRDASWKVTAGRLVKLTGKNGQSASFNFMYSPKNGGGNLENEWSDIAKALFILRFHRFNQTAPNHRHFLTAISYVAFYANKTNVNLISITPEILDKACRLISKHYLDSTAYRLHQAVAEFASHCDANRLCRVLFNYKYRGMKRPVKTSGTGYSRLDDPAVLETKHEKIIDPEVFRALGELYKNVPKDHKYRFYILVLTLLLCTGRRFSELSLLPYQNGLQKDSDGKEYLNYFPRKTSLGDAFTPKRKIYMPTAVLDIVRDVVKEINELCAPARDTARYIFDNGDIDLRFLSNVPKDKWLYRFDLEDIGLSPTLVDSTGWIRKNGYAYIDPNFLIEDRGYRRKKPYTLLKGVKAYCRNEFIDTSHTVLHIDQDRNKYFLKDLMLVRNKGLSSGYYACWDVSQCTHSMLTTFFRYLPRLADEYVTTKVKLDFTSHHFRHTLNTLLDEGGLTDVMQTEWFGRRNPSDTKAYQHTSPEKRALLIQEDIRKGRAKGIIAEQYNVIPVSQKEAFLKLRVATVQDVGAGMCAHQFSQMPCERHLQCSAECDDYLYIKEDKGRLPELKRQYAFNKLGYDAALIKSKSTKPKKSGESVLQFERKLRVLSEQLKFNGIDADSFDYKKYMDDCIKKQEKEAVNG